MISTKDIYELFGDLLEMISDEVLREKVVTTWVEGCKLGGWESIEQLKQMPFTLLLRECSINFIEHTRAVTRGALALLDAQVTEYATMPYPYDRDLIIAGGLLHDVGKLLEIEQAESGFRKSRHGMINRHPISGTVLAAKCGCDGPVLNVIACHSREGDGRPQCLETVLIHQADFAVFNPLVMQEKSTLIPPKERNDS